MIRLHITPENAGHLELLAALFSDMEIDGIEMMDDHFLVYTTSAVWETEDFRKGLDFRRTISPFTYSMEALPEINWNAEWEKHFDPVFVEDFLTIRASFHDLPVTTSHTITINPKMSFGTGHHATTWMMARSMSLLDVHRKSVLDAGSGTGILAILAALQGATEVLAFDNDPWCFANAVENVAENRVEDIVHVLEGGLEIVPDRTYDIVLANINKNFHLEHAAGLTGKTAAGGLLAISGFYDVDSKALLDQYLELHLVAQYLQVKDDWACIILRRMA